MKKLRTEMSARSQELRAKIKDKVNLRAKNDRIRKRKAEEEKYSQFNKFKDVVKWADAHREDLLDICAMQKELSSDEFSCDICTGDNILYIDLRCGDGLAIGYEMGEPGEEVFALYSDYGNELLFNDRKVESFIKDLAQTEFNGLGDEFERAISAWMDKYMNDEYIEEVMSKFEAIADGITDEYPDEVDESARKLNITKKRFCESKYFTTKYGKLAYVSESGNLYKTTKGKVLKFNESESVSEELKIKAMAAAKMLGVIAFLGDEELDKKYELFSRQKNIRAAKMAAAIKDIKAYRDAANKLKDERIGGKFVGSDEEYSESIGDDYEMDDDEMVKICEKYHDQIMTGYDALIQFNKEIEYYAPTCQYELDEAINNLKVVTQWVHMGANDQFYT